VGRRFLIVGSVCAALGASAATSGAARYVLVDEGWGSECYGSYDYAAGMVVPLSGGRPVVRRLQANLIRAVQFVDGGRLVVWADASGVRLADLRSGRSALLGRLVRSGRGGFFSVDRAARTALLASGGGRASNLVLVRRRGRHLARRPITDADGVRAELSQDGRYFTYSGARGIALRAVAGGAARWIGSAVTWSSFSAGRLAFLDAGGLHVLDARTGAHVLDLPVAAEPYGPVAEASWSPDGRYVLLGSGAVADVGGARISLLPASATEGVAWRPGSGHQLLRMTFGGTDLVDVATGTELWSRNGINYLVWSPDGRWLLNRDGAPSLLSHHGAAVGTPGSVEPWAEWLGADVLATSDATTLRVAAPPSWRPRVLTRRAPGHYLTATTIFSASPAGLRLMARTFRSRAHARDCG
jgi:hypothetical protein